MQTEQPAAVQLIGVVARKGADRKNIYVDLILAVRNRRGVQQQAVDAGIIVITIPDKRLGSSSQAQQDPEEGYHTLFVHKQRGIGFYIGWRGQGPAVMKRKIVGIIMRRRRAQLPTLGSRPAPSPPYLTL